MSDKNFKLLILGFGLSVAAIIGFYFYFTFTMFNNFRNDPFRMDDDAALRFEEAMRELEEEMEAVEEEKETWEEEIERELQEAFDSLENAN